MALGANRESIVTGGCRGESAAGAAGGAVGSDGGVFGMSSGKCGAMRNAAVWA
jgi:hypothetical protein